MFVATSRDAVLRTLGAAAMLPAHNAAQAAKALSGGGAMTDSSVQDLFVETFCDLPHAASLLPNMQGYSRGSSALAPPPVSKAFDVAANDENNSAYTRGIPDRQAFLDLLHNQENNQCASAHCFAA